LNGTNNAASGAATPDSSDRQEIGSGEHDTLNVPQQGLIQVIVVRGASLQMLQADTNLTVSDPESTLVLRGVGPFFPPVKGLDWAAGCLPLPPQFPPGVGDLRSLLHFLMDNSLFMTTDASRTEVETFMREIQP